MSLYKQINLIAPVGFCEDFESGLGFEIEHRQPELWRKSNLQCSANPAVTKDAVIWADHNQADLRGGLIVLI